MDETMDFAQESRQRAQVYRMLASLYFTELTGEQIEGLAELDFGAFAELDNEMARGAQEMRRALGRLHPGLREELAVDYAHIFLAAGSAKDEVRGVPYESVYTSEEGLLMGPARQSVYRIMRRERALPKAELRVPEDHLSFECEFMAAMAEKSARAAEAGNVAEARRCVDVQQGFRAEHLANWIGALCEAVERSARTRFYRGVSMVTRAFIRIDEELLAEGAALLDGLDA